MMTPATLDIHLEQAEQVLNYYRSLNRDQTETIVNFNFMARGEPLANRYFKVIKT